MGNYKAYFKDVRNCNNYEVLIIGDTANTNVNTYTEILLSGNEPFVVRYDTNRTPFDPIRTSTATIKVVHNNYLEDIMSPVARSTVIMLYNKTTNTTEWVGYLVPKVFDASYVNEYETFDLEAADCLSSLQYVKYTTNTAYTKTIVTIKSIIDKACDECGLLSGYYWGRSKKVGNRVLLPDHLKISEQNWFYSDVNESWDMLTIIEETCRYLGYTCLQWRDSLYFIDYQYMHNNDRHYVTRYAKSGGYTAGSSSYLQVPTTITKDSYLESNASISIEPIYNKVTVKANMYTIDNLIPDLFGDEYLHNRIDPDNFYANYEYLAESPTKPPFPAGLRVNSPVYKHEKVDKKEVDDADYRYFHRLYDHDYWESCYYDISGNTASPTEQELKSSAITRNYMGGTILDLGVVKKEYMSDYGQWIVPNKLDYTRYLCLSCKYEPTNYKFMNFLPEPINLGPYVLFKAKPGAIVPCITTNNAYLVIDYDILWTRYVNRPYINPDWIPDKCGVTVGAAGLVSRRIGNLVFRLKIGDKYWSGNSWQTYDTTFRVVVEKSSKEEDVWNTQLSVLNNVSWDLFVNAEGYKIPLSGVTLTDDIEFEILRPTYQFMYNGGNPLFRAWYSYNAYCWVSNLSIKVVEAGHEGDEENDIVYDNILNADAINELGEITVKLTTLSDMSKASYSTVIYNTGSADVPLTSITETSLSGNAQKPEENIIEKYVSQYSTSTKKITASLGLDITPFSKIKAIDVYEPTQGYVEIGTEIDYGMGTQTITMVEKK